MIGHEIHHSHYHLRRMGEMGRVFWAHTLLSLASALVTIFIPIFLLKSGYSFSAVLTYLAVQGLIAAVLQYPAGMMVGRLGPNRSMAVGIVMHIVFFAMLLTLPNFHWPLGIVAVAWALQRTTYWVAFHVNFSKARAHKKSGRQIGRTNIVKIVAGGLAPAVGGYLATAYGISWLYGVALGLYLLALIPLVGAPTIGNRYRPSLKRLNWAKIRPDLYANAGNAITTVAETAVWPLLVFTIVPTYRGVGALSSVVAIASIFTAFYVSRREEKRGERHYLGEGVTLASLSDVFRLFAQNAGHVFGVNLIGGMGNALYYTPFFSRYYQHADEEPRIQYIVAMEVAHEVAWAAFYFVLLGLSFILTSYQTLLVGVAFSIPANFLIRRIR